MALRTAVPPPWTTAYNALNNTPLVVSGPGVLANDTDPEGDKITVVSYTQPGNGTVTLNPDGSFTYTPKKDFCGMDRFSYKITDSICDADYQDEANVTINVRCLSCKVKGSASLTFSSRTGLLADHKQWCYASKYQQHQPDLAYGQWKRDECEAEWSGDICSGLECSFCNHQFRLDRCHRCPNH